MEYNLNISKGKTLLGEWVEGYYVFENNREVNLIWHNGTFVQISRDSLCRCTGRKTIKGRPLFENDIVFEEVEEDDGDRRLYYICKWINEWSKFAFLSYDEMLLYQDGEDSLLEDDGTFSIDWAEKYHYAGNFIDNPELLID